MISYAWMPMKKSRLQPLLYSREPTPIIPPIWVRCVTFRAFDAISILTAERRSALILIKLLQYGAAARTLRGVPKCIKREHLR
jgi:hypothetical protein